MSFIVDNFIIIQHMLSHLPARPSLSMHLFVVLCLSVCSNTKFYSKFFSRQLSDLLSDSFFYVCSSIHTNVIPQNGFQRSQTKYGYTEAAFVICGTYVIWHFFHYFWFEYILLSDMEMIEKL